MRGDSNPWWALQVNPSIHISAFMVAFHRVHLFLIRFCVVVVRLERYSKIRRWNLDETFMGLSHVQHIVLRPVHTLELSLGWLSRPPNIPSIPWQISYNSIPNSGYMSSNCGCVLVSNSGVKAACFLFASILLVIPCYLFAMFLRSWGVNSSFICYFWWVHVWHFPVSNFQIFLYTFFYDCCLGK